MDTVVDAFKAPFSEDAAERSSPKAVAIAYASLAFLIARLL